MATARDLQARKLRREAVCQLSKFSSSRTCLSSAPSSETEIERVEWPVREQYAARSMFCFETGVSHKWRLGPQAISVDWQPPARPALHDLNNSPSNLTSSSPF